MQSLDYSEDNVPDDVDLLPTGRKSRRVSWTQLQPSWASLLRSCLFLFLGFAVGVYLQSLKSTPFGALLNTFELNSTFTEAPSPNTDVAWQRLIPPGRGFVVVDPSERPLPYTGKHAKLSNIRAVSVFHQIHCLNELRIGFYSHHDIVDASQEHHSTAHMKHCFDYLRQALMCAADTTLEHLRSEAEEEIASVDGWGTKHQCRDYQKVFDWATSFRASGDGGIQ